MLWLKEKDKYDNFLQCNDKGVSSTHHGTSLAYIRQVSSPYKGQFVSYRTFSLNISSSYRCSIVQFIETKMYHISFVIIAYNSTKFILFELIRDGCICESNGTRETEQTTRE